MARRPRPPGARRKPKGAAAGPPPAHARSLQASQLAPLVAEFETSAPDLWRAPPDSGREVAFAGRSNAGKSSVLNRIAGQRSLARTSGTPGRTQLLNFFRVGENARLVDLPGYGYAKTDQATRRTWQARVEAYLANRQTLVGVVLVMDIRHPFQEFDERMITWARMSALPLLILLNKADKLGHGARVRALREAEARVADLPNVQPLLFSAMRGQGTDQVLTILREWRWIDGEPPPDPMD